MPADLPIGVKLPDSDDEDDRRVLIRRQPSTSRTHAHAHTTSKKTSKSTTPVVDEPAFTATDVIHSLFKASDLTARPRAIREGEGEGEGVEIAPAQFDPLINPEPALGDTEELLPITSKKR